MSLDFRNVNTIWGSLIAESFAKLGLQTAVISPGSRSTPLTVAFAQHPQINCIPILDERSASFFALGVAKKSNLPTVLICTSGTAGANFFPAIIEAKYSHIPLIILTADRPPELRNCHAGQTINQVNLYGNYPQWQTELAMPDISLEKLFYLRQNLIYGWERSQFPVRGIVHLNIPFDEPLAPQQTLNLSPEKQDFIKQQLLANFPQIDSSYFDFNRVNYHLDNLNLDFQKRQFYQKETSLNLQNNVTHQSPHLPISPSPNELFVANFPKNGIIIAGVDSTNKPREYCQAIANLANNLNFPVLTEALSPVRNYSDINDYLITNYEAILRNENYAQKLVPEIIILIGEYPTSKTLRNWLNKYKIKTYIITDNYDNLDAIHTNSIHLRINPLSLNKSPIKKQASNLNNQSKYFLEWQTIDNKINQNFNLLIKQTEELIEAKLSWLLSQKLPPQTPVFIANSMSIRYAEFFWQKNNHQYSIYFSRGANGIDGTLSTTLGVAYQNKSSVLLTGDLALLHDINGFLIKQNWQGSLTIILVNNNGGGIFEMLPIAEYDEIFEDYFATPQAINFANVAKTYNLEYKLINNWQELEFLISNLPSQGIRILEIKTDRKYDSWWLNNYFSQLADIY